MAWRDCLLFCCVGLGLLVGGRKPKRGRSGTSFCGGPTENGPRWPRPFPHAPCCPSSQTAAKTLAPRPAPRKVCPGHRPCPPRPAFSLSPPCTVYTPDLNDAVSIMATEPPPIPTRFPCWERADYSFGGEVRCPALSTCLLGTADSSTGQAGPGILGGRSDRMLERW